MSVKKDILWRVGVIYLLMAVTGLAIIAKIVWLQFGERDKWSVNSDTAPIKEVAIDANRGDIYSSDGKLLAVSVPYYDIRMDLTVDSLTDDVFWGHIDALSRALASTFRDRSWIEYKRGLIKARQAHLQYYLVKRDITYDQMIRAREFPIFDRGRYKGGIRFIEKSERVKPNGYLASRTIGSTTMSERGNIVGLEGAYDKDLRGKAGLRLYKRLSGNIYVPLYDKNEVDPEDGMDVITTIDLNIQDVAEKALYKQLRKHNAHHGTAILMEVRTGDVKAVANLERRSNGDYWESVNFGVGESTVPGSTFKAASLMVALEDGLINIDDSVVINHGVTHYYGVKVEDSEWNENEKITIRRAFEISSNVGITRAIYDHYKGKEDEFIKGLYDLGLNRKLGIEILGEGEPFIKSPSHSDWSGVSLPMIAMGYELTLTPLQILTFYNAIADQGREVKPRFVKEIRYRGDLVDRKNIEVLNPSICSKNTLKAMHEMLCGVVERGTARRLNKTNFKIAGKTGTAQIPDKKTGYRVKSRITYQASFVGYFPADDPKYSCIVVINSPSNDIYYGSLVAGPVFLEIANKVYATQLDIHDPVNLPGRPVMAGAPYSKSGSYDDLTSALAHLHLSTDDESQGSPWVTVRSDGDAVKILPREIPQNLVPNVKDMGLMDAVYLLEKSGLKVRVNGRGTVRAQSILPGTVIRRGQTINLEMSLKDS